MSNIEIFNDWYKKLSESEQSELLSKIIESKLTLCMEGVFSGPAGVTLNKGLYSGPAGQLVSGKCVHCGR